MICNNICPRNSDCNPLSNVIACDKSTFVCIGLHNEEKDDKYRHCFKTETTDSCFDYDEYDLKSVISVMSEAIILNEIKNGDT
jgi:hypothetical protein